MTEIPAPTATPRSQAPDEPVGTLLARARESAGLSLEEVARRLRFAPRQLDALERGDWGRLPGGAAVRGMVRSYARMLGLDAEALVRRAGEDSGATDAARLAMRFRQPVPFSDGARRSNLAYVALSVVLLGVVGVVAFEWRQEQQKAGQLSFVPAAQMPAEPARVALASAAPSAAVTPSVSAPAAAAPAEESAMAGAQRQILLRFERESWVEIRSGTGKLLVSQLHAAGTERVVAGLPPFSVVIGNAQHVQLIYDERPVDLMPHVRVEVARFTLE